MSKLEKIEQNFFSQDKDPYVRKTAVICVAKMFSLNPQLVQDRSAFLVILFRRHYAK